MTEREYHINYSDPVAAAKTVLQFHIDTLVSFRGTTASHPEELEWEIRPYEYMLEDLAVRLKQCQGVRYGEIEPGVYVPPLSKKEMVAKLGCLVQDQGWGLLLLAAFANPILTVLYANTKTKESK
jgi:hypothetical protein